jgi:hypothetical protein
VRLGVNVPNFGPGTGPIFPNGAVVARTEHAGAGPADIPPEDLPHLRRRVEPAAEAVGAGDFPFGSVLLAADGRVLASAYSGG